MKKRYTVRVDKKTSRFIVWDRLENKVCRSFPKSTKLCAVSSCKYLNNQENKKAVIV